MNVRKNFGAAVAAILAILAFSATSFGQQALPPVPTPAPLIPAVAPPTPPVGVPVVAPPTSPPPKDDIRDRLEKLERQNEFLLKKLQEQPAEVTTPVSTADPTAVKGLDVKAPKIDPKDTKLPVKDAGEKTYEVGKNLKMEAMWKNGMYFESADKAFKYTVGGTIQFDMGWYAAPQSQVNSIGLFNNYADPSAALMDGMDFRRARLRFSGTAYEVIDYFAQYDFANSIDLRRRTIGVTSPTVPTIYDMNPGEATQFNEVYVGLTQIPLLGAVRVGHHREGLNFITHTADRNQVWMERGLLFDAFNGDFNFASGVTVDRTYLNERAYSWFGFFQNNSRGFSTLGDGTYAYDGRLCALLIDDPDKELWVHVGVDYSYRNLTQNQIRYRARPMLRIGTGTQVPNIVDTGTFYSLDGEQIVNLEYASACGPWTFAAEGSVSWIPHTYTGGVPKPDGSLPTGVAAKGAYMAQGMYVELLRFLTPDHRTYRKERPGYDRVAPRENYFFVYGEDGTPIWARGAWEAGVRYDALDLSNGNINGGTAQAVTGCINWYLNPNTRFQWNYFVMHREFNPADTSGRVNGTIQGFGMRVNMDF